MKFLPIIFLLSIQLSAQNWIDFNETIQIDDTIYSKAPGLPYTGLITESAENGQIIWKARTIKGLYNGKYFSFYDNGDTLQKGEYKNGKLSGFVYHYTSNSSFGIATVPHCWLKIKYINGVRNGISETYYENGKPFISSVYVNNVQSGECSVYYKTGQLFAKGKLENRECSGSWIVFKKDKTVSSNLVFTNGVVSSCEGECIDIYLYNTNFDSLTNIPIIGK